ncbi:MAG TPA: hypothetical protein VEC09_09930 [Actinomycetota bacterium]|nr:hypothetical protein [Actinomycetota bacterium]
MEEQRYRVRETRRVPSSRDASNWRIVLAPADGAADEALVVTVSSPVFAAMDLDAPFTAADVAALQRVEAV